MAQQTFRANLTSANFPLSSGFYGMTIVVPQQDQHYIRPNEFSGALADKNIGIPQILFCENVMPFSGGFQSIGYSTPVLASGNLDFDQAFYLSDVNEAKTLFVPAGGKCYLYDSATKSWTALNKAGIPVGAGCSVANLKGRTFVHFAGNANFYEWVGGTLSNVALTGLVPSAVNGLTTASGFLIAWNFNTIFWSSAITPTDFTPSLVTGAGSQIPLGLKGEIISCKPTNDGFIIYTSGGAIYARWSGNIRFPWVFSAVISASGLEKAEHSCDEPNGYVLYVYTTDGLQQFDRLRASPVFPEVSEFAALGYIEKYDKTLQQIIKTSYSGQGKLNVKVAFIANRWFVFSYGVPGTAILSHALIFDTGLKRWGKVAIDHVDCFEFFGDSTKASGVGALAWNQLGGNWAQQNNSWSAYGSISATQQNETIPYQSIGFLGQDGRVSVIDFAHTIDSDIGIFYLGRFQFIRSRLFQIQDVESVGIDQIKAGNKLAVLTSLDGANFDKTSYPMVVKTKQDYTRWQMRLAGINHTLRFEGNFQLNTVLVTGQILGNR